MTFYQYILFHCTHHCIWSSSKKQNCWIFTFFRVKISLQITRYCNLTWNNIIYFYIYIYYIYTSWPYPQLHNSSLLFLSNLVTRHAKSREPRNLVLGHFWKKFQTFFWNQSFKGKNSKLCRGFPKNRLKWMPISIHFYLKHHYSINMITLYLANLSK